jgi:hypothetical protein
MLPDASEIVRRRLTAFAVLRVIALVCMLPAVGPLAFLASEALDPRFNRSSFWSDLPASVAVIIVMLLPGFSIWWGARWFARWMVPVHARPRCPRCDYALEGLTEPVCPECGLPLTREFMPGSPPPPPASREDQIVRLRDTFTPVVRLIALLVAGAAWAIAGFTTAAFIVDTFEYGAAGFERVRFAVFVGVLVLIAIIATGAFIKSRAVVAGLVPKSGPLAPEPPPALKPGKPESE